MTIRRPLTATALSFAGGIAAADITTVHSHRLPLCSGAAVSGVLLFLCFFICKNFTILQLSDRFSKKLTRILLLVLSFFLFGLLAGSVSFHRQSQLAPFEGQEVTVSGVVLNAVPKDSETAVLTLRLTKNNTCRLPQGEQPLHPEKFLINIYQYQGENPRLLTGRRVTISGKVNIPSSVSNPGCFDYQKYLRSEKIYATLTAYGSSLQIKEIVRPLYFRLAVFKAFYEKRLMESMPADPASLLCGIMFGDTAYMSEDLLDSFRENGIGHLLAASGLHVGFVYSVINRLFRRPRTTLGNLPVVGTLILYAALACFSASVVRSVFMITVLIISRTSVQRYDFLTSISFCALVLLIYEPAYLFSSGFQLSFLAVVSLAVILPVTEKMFSVTTQDERDMMPADQKKYQLKRSAAETASAMLAIQLGMTPVTLMSFHYVSFAGLILNTPSIALAGLIVPIGILLVPLSFVPSFFYEPAAWLTELSVQLLMALNRMFSVEGISCHYFPTPAKGMIFFFYFLLFFCCSEAGQRLLSRLLHPFCLQSALIGVMILASAASLCTGAGYACSMEFLQNDLIFVDVGQGDCAHLKTRHANLLFDSGGSTKKDIGKDTLMPYFLGNGVGSIDLAVISHLHTDHYEGLKTLAKYVPVRHLLLSAAYRSRADEISTDTGVPVSRMIFAAEGDHINIDGAAIEVLAPFPRSEEEFAVLASKESEENDCSLVTRVEYRNTSVLFTGDIDQELEQKLVRFEAEKLDSSILKTAHHGSRYSSCPEFLNAVSPSIAVVQVGKNLYGHPTPEALQRLEDAGAAIYRNDQLGAVLFRLHGNGSVQVSSMK